MKRTTGRCHKAREASVDAYGQLNEGPPMLSCQALLLLLSAVLVANDNRPPRALRSCRPPSSAVPSSGARGGS